MRGGWFGIVFGTLVMLVGLAQAWKPEEAIRAGDRFTPRRLRADWSNDLWLLRLAGVVASLVGLGILVANLRSV